MATSIRERLREAVLREERKTAEARRPPSGKARAEENMFRPVCQAAEEIREELAALPSLEFTINPTSVWITLLDRELCFTYDAEARRFLGEEIGHSWYDGETYTDLHTWPTAAECIDAMIRLSATYARMARALQSAARIV
jgi:hypothetical protein